MTDPGLMLLDEPSDAIKPTLAVQIAETQRPINPYEGTTIVIVEQNVPLVLSTAGYRVVLEKGHLVAQGARDEVAESAVMKEYLAI